MLIQKQPNRWSCLPCSFAIVLGIPVSDLIFAIGHNGSEIIWPTQPEPLCRRGFNVQEILDVLVLDYGKAVTCIDVLPESVSSDTLPPFRPYTQQQAMTRINRYLSRYNGVTTGQCANGARHSMAAINGKLIDPNDGLMKDNLAYTIWSFYIIS